MEVQEVKDELHADEGEDQRQPGGEVDKTVEQAGDQEEQSPQAEQRERVGDEDDVGVPGDAEHGRDRVQREQQVGAADRHQNEDQRRQSPPSGGPGHELWAVGVAGERQQTASHVHEDVVFDVRL